MSHCAFVSFRLGMTDGVSVVVAAWERSLHALGWTTSRVAGEGDVDHVVPGLEIGAAHPPDPQLLRRAVADADLVVAENILTIPMNLEASRVVAEVLAGHPTIVHHHDPPWQRDRFLDVTELPADDPAWIHVTINSLTEDQFAARGLTATTIYNGFDTSADEGDRATTRHRLDVADHDVLVAHPVRAIARKNIPTALAIAEAVGGTYWLPGPAEEDYGPTLHKLLADAVCPIRTETTADLGPTTSMSDLYAAADLIVFPSTWEGFGNPPLEAAVHHRPVVVGHYPVADELRHFGFWWLDPHDHDAIRAAVAKPPMALLAKNRELVDRHFSLDVLTERVKDLLDRAGFR